MGASRKNTYFIRHFLQNLLVCALVIALITPLCISFYTSFDRHQRENYRNTLQVMLNDVNDNLDIMCNLVRNVEISESLQHISLIRGKTHHRDTIALMKSQNYVETLTQSNPYIADCIVAFAQNDVLLTGHSVYYDIAEFSKFYYLNENALSDWINTLKAHKANTKCMPISQYTYIPYDSYYAEQTEDLAFCYGILFDSFPSKGAFYLLIQKDALLEKIPEHFLSFSSLSLLNAEGEPVFSYQGDDYQTDARSFSVDLGSSSSMLRLTATLNTTAISNMISSTRHLLYFYLAAAFAIVVALAGFFTMRQFRPMKSVLEQLRDFGYTLPRDKEQFTFVIQAIKDMQLKHRDVTRTLAVYRDQLRDTQLERLLSSPYTPDMQMSDTLPEKYRIGYAYILPDEKQPDSSLLGPLIMRQMRHCVPASVRIHQIANDVFALIVPTAVSTDELRNMLAAINADIPQTLCLSMSAEAKGPESMHAAFENARMNSIGQSAADVLRMPQENLLHQGIGVQAGTRIYQEIITGNSKSACECIGEIMRNPSSPFQNVAECYEYIRLNICFAIQDAHLPETLAPPPSPGAVPPEKLLQLLLTSVEQLCQTEKVRALHQKTQLETEIFAWVEENLHDGMLNAEMVAHRFAISERKVQSIARQTGEASFSAYVQRQRMLLVAKLLAETALPVNDICIRAGYNTPSTFFKAFKRIYGISPGEYRTLHSKST